ncbi:hypothetical protein M4578_25035 [Salipiger sp. P9]|uniref:hypothetical protein n=1 Tax=Salipiger pentaromativorans TaxID=2943193 RepID=UPI00215764AB|nr:hypothetical protein [Salipiger pentaromativorans]MCR8551096.1 hypothetical protein [Salipiger pentaromativorans]
MSHLQAGKFAMVARLFIGFSFGLLMAGAGLFLLVLGFEPQSNNAILISYIILFGLVIFGVILAVTSTSIRSLISKGLLILGASVFFIPVAALVYWFREKAAPFGISETSTEKLVIFSTIALFLGIVLMVFGSAMRANRP